MMNVNPLSSNLVGLLNEEPLKSSNPLSGSFSDILTEAMNNVRNTDKSDKVSALALMTGQADDMSALLLDAQKAEIALNLAMQLRTKVLDAYSEIMRMQL